MLNNISGNSQKNLRKISETSENLRNEQLFWRKNFDFFLLGKQLPSQTVNQDVTKMQQLMKQINLVNAATEHQKVSTFMRSLDSRYKFHVQANNSITLADAVNTAKEFELSYNELATQSMGIVQNNNAN